MRSGRPTSLDRPLHTLGPRGTDSETVADSVSDDVRLAPTFRAALEAAASAQEFALVAAGFIDVDDDGTLRDDWGTLNFEAQEPQCIRAVWWQPTRPMAFVARTPDGASVERVALHSATRHFARTIAPQARQLQVPAKPLALAAVSRGEADACITSLDLVAGVDDLHVVEVFHPEMVWVLYGPRDRRVTFDEATR